MSVYDTTKVDIFGKVYTIRIVQHDDPEINSIRTENPLKILALDLLDPAVHSYVDKTPERLAEKMIEALFVRLSTIPEIRRRWEISSNLKMIDIPSLSDSELKAMLADHERVCRNLKSVEKTLRNFFEDYYKSKMKRIEYVGGYVRYELDQKEE